MTEKIQQTKLTQMTVKIQQTIFSHSNDCKNTTNKSYSND